MPLCLQLGHGNVAQRAVQGVAFRVGENEKNLHDGLFLSVGGLSEFDDDLAEMAA